MAAPKKYRVGKSKIQGQGVFAKKDLNVGEYIGKAHTINELYTDYDFTELGKKHNHSEDSNVQNILIGNERHLVATRPIKKGEELTSNYRLQQDLEQPEDFKQGGKLTSSKARKILHDKEVHGHPLTDKQRRFFGAIAGGAKPYKAQFGGIGGLLTGFHPRLAETASEVLSAPQKAATKLVTGKYQTPSEALDIQNAAGAFLTDVVLDPLGLLGIGAAKKMGALDNVYKINPLAKKTLSDPNKSYRVAGMDAYDDFVESGFLRSKTPMPQPGMSFAERMQQRPTAFPSFQKGFADLRYLPKEGGVVFETSLPTLKRGEINPVTGFPIKGRHYAHRVIDPETGKTLSRIPAKDIKVFEPKPHWLRGYKEVKPPKKKQDGGAIEGTMGGLTDKGFNYNGAWGGPSMQLGGNIQPAMAGAVQTVSMAQLGDSVKPITMQLAMGGSLPGSVGFTYARVAGAAPANGPYAKKTKASADNGASMRYYQEGLDFKPKTISKNGGWLDKFDNGGVSVNNADAQPLKKLDQLLNFTNYNKPTKGGWLDKYN